MVGFSSSFPHQKTSCQDGLEVGIYTVLIGSLGLAPICWSAISSLCLTFVLTENCISIDRRCILFMAQKGISLAFESLSGTP